MKKTVAFVAVFFLLFSSTFAAGGSASRGTAREPRIRYIWEFQKQLGLSAQQVANLQQIYKEDKQNTLQLQADLAVGQTKLQALLDKDAPIDDIKAQLEKNAGIQVSLTLADIVKTRKIKKVITQKQLQEWLAIQQRINREETREQKQ